MKSLLDGSLCFWIQDGEKLKSYIFAYCLYIQVHLLRLICPNKAPMLGMVTATRDASSDIYSILTLYYMYHIMLCYMIIISIIQMCVCFAEVRIKLDIIETTIFLKWQ